MHGRAAHGSIFKTPAIAWPQERRKMKHCSVSSSMYLSEWKALTHVSIPTLSRHARAGVLGDAGGGAGM